MPGSNDPQMVPAASPINFSTVLKYCQEQFEQESALRRALEAFLEEIKGYYPRTYLLIETYRLMQALKSDGDQDAKIQAIATFHARCSSKLSLLNPRFLAGKLNQVAAVAVIAVILAAAGGILGFSAALSAGLVPAIFGALLVAGATAALVGVFCAGPVVKSSLPFFRMRSSEKELMRTLNREFTPAPAA